MTDDLLRQYVETRSPEAFGEIVRRYVDLVYSCARRQVGGDAHLAEDVTQSVFLLLAQKAEHVPLDRPVSAWLVKAAGYFAANMRRSRERRDNYERRAAAMAPVGIQADAGKGEPDWELLSPMLDQGISKLPREYRDALLLRYFEKKTLQQVGEVMGVSKEAAQKRVERAIDKLRTFFVGRGVTTMSAVSLTALLSEQAVSTAPDGLAASVVSAAGSSSAPAQGAAALFMGEKLKWVAAASIMLALGIGGVIIYRSSQPSSKAAVRMLPPASPVSPAVLPADWRGKFSDGTQIEVIALNDPSKPGQWWTLDGSPTVDPEFPPVGAITISYKQARRIDLVVRMTGVALDKKGVTVRSDVPSRSVSVRNGSATERLIKSYIPVPRGATSGNLRVGLAGGSWTGELKLDCGKGQDQPQGFTDSGVEITEERGRTLVRVPISADLQSKDVETSVVAGGRELRPIATLVGSHFTYTFRCTRSEVTSIIVRSRPYQWIEFKNVAFWPLAKPTSVAVDNAGQATSMAR